MPERRLLAATKITDGWKLQFPIDVRDALEKRDKKKFKIGERVAFYQEPDGRIVVEHA